MILFDVEMYSWPDVFRRFLASFALEHINFRLFISPERRERCVLSAILEQTEVVTRGT